jgi:DNA-directed RNA polymerase subunit M/transcription elongation factor TFIIS
MKFCPVCRNMLYAIDEDTDETGKKFAVQQCRKCSYKEAITRENPVIYDHSLREDKSVRLAVNPYLKYDPTLPRFKEIVCPNDECPSKSGADPDVVGVKIDQTRVIWMYQCANCDQTWKQSARAV